MRRRDFIAFVGGAAATWPLVVQAQESDRVHRIGVLSPYAESDPEGQARAAALQKGLEKLGWTVGRNLRIDYRWSVDTVERTHAAIIAILAPAPEVVLAGTRRTVAALQQATRAVPIVFTMIYEPVGQGFVASLAHPGGNTTGFTNVEATVGAKWLELLKQIAPHLARAAFLFNPNNPGPMQTYHSVEAAALNDAVQTIKTPVRGQDEIEAALAKLGGEPTGGLIVPPDGFLADYRKLIIELAARYQLPAVYGLTSFAEQGGLVAYGVNVLEQERQSAEYVDRILHGEKAGDLPVQQPTRYELVINLKTAKALGLNIPHSLLVIADEVIE
jgi:putative tryptophan/tyrosine transport system substrate-binding protein